MMRRYFALLLSVLVVHQSSMVLGCARGFSVPSTRATALQISAIGMTQALCQSGIFFPGQTSRSERRYALFRQTGQMRLLVSSLLAPSMAFARKIHFTLGHHGYVITLSWEKIVCLVALLIFEVWCWYWLWQRYGWSKGKGDLDPQTLRVSLNFIREDLDRAGQALEHYQSSPNDADRALFKETIHRVDRIAEYITIWDQGYAWRRAGISDREWEAFMLLAPVPFRFWDRVQLHAMDKTLIRLLIPHNDGGSRQMRKRILVEIPGRLKGRGLHENIDLLLERALRKPQAKNILLNYLRTIGSSDAHFDVATGGIVIRHDLSMADARGFYTHEMIHMILRTAYIMWSKIAPTTEGPEDYITSALQILVMMTNKEGYDNIMAGPHAEHHTKGFNSATLAMESKLISNVHDAFAETVRASGYYAGGAFISGCATAIAQKALSTEKNRPDKAWRVLFTAGQAVHDFALNRNSTITDALQSMFLVGRSPLSDREIRRLRWGIHGPT